MKRNGNHERDNPQGESQTDYLLFDDEKASLYQFVSDAAAKQRREIDKSKIDTRTGLLTYQAWEDEVHMQLGRRRRKSDQAARGMILIADLDKFKLANTVFGHPYVDIMILQPVGKAVADSLLRQSDLASESKIPLAGRYAGDEISVWLPETDIAGAIVVANRIQTNVNQIEYRDPQDTLHRLNGRTTQGISIGIAPLTLLRSSDPREVLFQSLIHADQAMYAAKESGLNAIRLYTPPDQG